MFTVAGHLQGAGWGAAGSVDARVPTLRACRVPRGASTTGGVQ